VHGARENFDVDEETGVGEALPFVVGLLDPRPQADTPELRKPRDAAVVQLAEHIYAAAAVRGGDLHLPPMGKFYSSAELSLSAVMAVQTVMSEPWACEALSRAGFYTVAADLLQEKALSPGAVATVAKLFSTSGDDSHDPQRLALARRFLGLGFLQYLLDRCGGTVHCLSYSAV
jgi:hypothetical protein